MDDGEQSCAAALLAAASKVFQPEALDTKMVEDAASGKVNIDNKEKSKVGVDDACQYDLKVASPDSDHLKTSASGSTNSKDSSNSDLSYHDDDEVVDDGDDCADDAFDDYYDDDNDGDGAYTYEDDCLPFQSEFDNVDLPSGVEASIPWLLDPSLASVKSGISPQDEAKGKASTCSSSHNKSEAGSTSASAVATDLSSKEEVKGNREKDLMEKFKDFKQFDMVEDFSDHHYSGMGFLDQPPPKNWAKTIQEEWKILEQCLPSAVWVRVYESRMELLRAVIEGPRGTPYHDGLFVFDCFFPTDYPNEPPRVYYYSGGLYLNPNLYACGKVCLSLLGTWHGQPEEKWMPGTSTMLQVLVSIQGLILNEEPYFNEPGYEKTYGSERATRSSHQYNEQAFIMSLKTMLYTLRKPPKYFEEFVMGHFLNRARDILVACKSYMDGAKVGKVAVKDGVAVITEAGSSASGEFRASMKEMINALIDKFRRFGSIDCEQFRVD